MPGAARTRAVLVRLQRHFRSGPGCQTTRGSPWRRAKRSFGLAGRWTPRPSRSASACGLRWAVPGLGSSTLKALRDLSAGAHWALAGARGEYAAGAGAAMRIAPLAFLLDPASADDRVLIRDVARITHHS